MSAQAAPRGGAAQRRSLLSIGQVLARLTPEFPDLAPSKLRFLEDQGLIAPSRTPSGYRKFSADDVDRVRYILTLQRDHYLPLKVILAHLEQVDAGEAQPFTAGNVVSEGPSILRVDRRLSRRELETASGAPRALVQEAIAASLVPAAEPYDERAVRVVQALVELRRFGIEPRHLRGMRASAEREAALIESAVRPVLGRRGEGRPEAAEAARDIAGQIAAIREVLGREAVERIAR
ncbi:transcriptional regulator FtsR [Agrococcus sp. SGAir0287]|uniref:transcriptional regulator FtsR n=1 Tax=Agrococcus sp. SGAir0287 TaxID=2070347 RepID=UPI0010CD1CE3|nr:MerR family transcriptional regulator [Agrococcus sp. SGAir0287]QCR19521.1 MerR family transcriptional regulator [Agrococcus sp. SGAir0287]